MQEPFDLPTDTLNQPSHPEVSDETRPPVDLEHVYDAMGDEAAEIIELYLSGTTRDLDRLGTAIQANDAMEVRLIAHNCAGTSATCGMVAVVPLFRALEDAGRYQCLSNAPALLADAKVQFQRICSFLLETNLRLQLVD
jgi:HPt (histidine-containing phosphotransfer) domain-containing protein